jgi:hypothetical protein
VKLLHLKLYNIDKLIEYFISYQNLWMPLEQCQSYQNGVGNFMPSLYRHQLEDMVGSAKKIIRVTHSSYVRTLLQM